jgi:hypothetical protein
MSIRMFLYTFSMYKSVSSSVCSSDPFRKLPIAEMHAAGFCLSDVFVYTLQESSAVQLCRCAHLPEVS